MNTPLVMACRVLACFVLLPGILLGQDIKVNTESAGARAHFIQGMKAFDAAQFDAARMHWDKAIEADPEFAAPHQYRTWVATSASDWNAHREHTMSLRDGASPFIQNLIDQGEAGVNSDRERTMELALELVAENPRLARAYTYLAGEYGGHKEYALQRGALRTAMALQPGFAPAYKNMATSLTFNEPKDFQLAAKYAKKYVRLAGDAADSYIVMGDVYRAENDFAMASKAYGMAIEVDPSHATAHSKKGHADTYLGDYDAARADFAMAAEASNTLGQKTAQRTFVVYTHLYAGDIEGAMTENASLLESLKGEDGNKAAFPLRGTYSDRLQIAMHHGMFDEAEDALESRMMYTDVVIEQVDRPGEWASTLHAGDLLLAGLIAAKKGDLDKAREMAGKNKEMLANQTDKRRLEGYHRLMGVIDLNDGNAEGAIEHLKYANDQSQFVKYELGLAYEAAGNDEMAKKMYSEVAGFSFNSIGTAICRSMAKDKIAM